GLLVALVSLEGGALPLLYIAVLLGCETITRVWPPRRLLPILRAGAVVVGVGVGVGAVRLFPVIDQLRSHKRPLAIDLHGMDLGMVFDAFTNRHLGHMQRVPHQTYVWGEYGAYLGLVLFGLAVVGVLVAGIDKAWLVGLLVIAMALTIGYHGDLSIWSILNR